MTLPTTIEFSFKWAYINSSYTTMKYTSTQNIPIWNYDKLQKIVVTNSSINPVLNFILFDKSRVYNPALHSALSSYNLHGELFKFENLYASGDIRYDKLYGQEYIKMNYLKIMNSNLEIGWLNYPDRSFNVTYTYDYFEYDFTKKGALPLEFIFKDYNFTSESVQKYKTMGYTAEELIKAGLKFSQLLNAGYNITDELFPVLCKLYSDIDVDFIYAINRLKNANTRLTTQNITLITENNTLKDANISLTANNDELKNTNITVNNTNITVNNTNILLKDTNNILKSTNTVLIRTNTILSTGNNKILMLSWVGRWRWAIKEVIRRQRVALSRWHWAIQEVIKRHNIGLH